MLRLGLTPFLWLAWLPTSSALRPKLGCQPVHGNLRNKPVLGDTGELQQSFLESKDQWISASSFPRRVAADLLQVCLPLDVLWSSPC